MREILFKAKRTDTDAWIEGNYLNDEEIAYISGFIYNNTIFGFEKIPFKCQVIPETVSQFTGLYDKNGVRICENDIVYYDGSCYKVVFENRNGTGYFGIVVGENETWGFGNSTPAYMMAVVGNIYDNPELLDVTE